MTYSEADYLNTLLIKYFNDYVDKHKVLFKKSRSASAPRLRSLAYSPSSYIILFIEDGICQKSQTDGRTPDGHRTDTGQTYGDPRGGHRGSFI